MVSLRERTIKELERNIGLSYSEMISLDEDQEINFVESKTGTPLTFSTKKDTCQIGRGNPLLARKKITTIEEINFKIDSMR